MAFKYLLLEDSTSLKQYIETFDYDRITFMDTESTGLNVLTEDLLGFSFFQENVLPCFIPVQRKYWHNRGISIEELREILNPFFERSKAVFHNAKYDLHVYRQNGFVEPYLESDTTVDMHLYDPDLRKNLEERVFADFGYAKKKFKDITGLAWNKIVWDENTLNLFTLEQMAEYASEDAYWTSKLYDKYSTLLHERGEAVKIIHDRIEIPMVNVLIDMKERGILINVPFLQEMGATIDVYMKKLTNQIHAEAGYLFNHNSPDQLHQVLLKLGMTSPFMTKGGKKGIPKPSYDKTAMEWLIDKYADVKMFQLLKQYAEVETLATSYVNKIPLLVDADGMLRCDLNSTGTVTGRFSCSGPNLQNQPNNKKYPVRAAFKPLPGRLMCCLDYSQIELRVAAHVSKDGRLVKAFWDGRDIHQEVADGIGRTREEGKCVHPNSLILVNGKFQDIGSLHIGRVKDTFYAITDKQVLSLNKQVEIKRFYSNGICDTRLIMTRRGIAICTNNHRFVLEDGSLKKAKDLAKNDVLQLTDYSDKVIAYEDTYIKFNPFFDHDVDNMSLLVDEKWAYFFGVYTGDGCYLTDGSQAGFAAGVGGQYDTWRDSIIEFCNELGLPVRASESQARSNSMYLGSTKFCQFLEKAGYVKKGFGKTLRIPTHILNAPRKVRVAFLSGLIDSDGTIETSGSVNITTKSIFLVQDLTVLLSTLGYKYGVEPSYNKTYGKYYYRIHIFTDSIVDFNNESIMRCKWKVKKLAARAIKTSQRKYKIAPKENQVTLNIDFGKQYVCDIEVNSREHLYSINTLFGHNTMNFAIFYGLGAASLGKRLGITEDEAQQMIDDYFETYSGVRKWKKGVENSAKQRKYCVNMFGRIRPFPLIGEKRFYFASLRQAVNTVIQGSAADMIKIAMINLHSELINGKYKGEADMLLQVHDELMFDVRSDLAEEFLYDAKRIMENVTPMDVPIIAEGKVVDNWSQMKAKNFPGYQDDGYKFDVASNLFLLN